MKQLLKKLFFAGAFVLFVASPVVAIATPQTTYAAAGDCEARILGVPPWYRGLTKSDDTAECTIVSPNDVGGISNFIWKIVLNGIEIALVLTAYIALFFILYGGFLFITGGGNSSQVEKARKSIFNAVIGLIISMGAIAITNLAFGVLGEATATNEFGVPEIAAGDLLQNGINLVYYIAGIAAVIVIIIAGITYATSMGDSSRITRAKNMILYSVIGLGILFAAFAITNFVLDRF
jgi:hypothetical protein